MANGSVCNVCMIDHRTSKRLLTHLRNVTACRQAYLAADIEEPSIIVKGDAKAFLAPLKVLGPKPWWATLAPQENPAPSHESPDLTTAILALVMKCHPLEVGRALAKQAQELFRGILALGMSFEEYALTLETLPLSTPGLSRANDLADVFQRMLTCHTGAYKGTQFQVFWKGTRALIAHGNLPHAEHLKVLLEAD